MLLGMTRFGILLSIFLFGRGSVCFASSPLSQFKVSENRVWKLVQNHEDAVVFIKDKSSKKQTIVLRVFDQTQDVQVRSDFFKNYQEKISEARKRLLETSGVGRTRIIDAIPIRTLGGNKIDGMHIESDFENSNGEVSQVFERQYYIGRRIYQVTYLSEGTDVSREQAKHILDVYEPKVARVPASSEVARAGTSGTYLQNKNPNLESPPLIIQKKINADECSHIPLEKRRGNNESASSISSSFIEGSSGCMSGVIEMIKDTFHGLVDLVSGLYKYSTNSVEREQMNAAMAIVWGEFSKDPKAFTQRVAANIYNIAAQQVDDFKCLNAHAQAQAICKILPAIIPTGLLLKLASRTKMAGSEITTVSKLMKAEVDNVKKAEKPVEKVVEPANKLDSQAPAVSSVPPVTKVNLTAGELPKTKAEAELVLSEAKSDMLAKKAVSDEMSSKVATLRTELSEIKEASEKASMAAYDAQVLKLDLVTESDLQKLPKGTVLYSILGEKVVVGKDPISMEAHQGVLTYGFLPKGKKLPTKEEVEALKMTSKKLNEQYKATKAKYEELDAESRVNFYTYDEAKIKHDLVDEIAKNGFYVEKLKSELKESTNKLESAKFKLKSRKSGY